MKKPNAETQAAMKEARNMTKARFATPQELFDSLYSNDQPPPDTAMLKLVESDAPPVKKGKTS